MTYGTNERPTIGESYASAVGNGSTRVGNDSDLRTAGDVVAAAGMSPYRTGTALMRLMSEWQSGAVPKVLPAPSPKELRVRGMAADLVQAESRRLAAVCADWNLQEMMLRFQRMKTLPALRAGLLHWCREKGWDDGIEQLVADTLRHFLAPVCAACEGRKRKVIQSRAIGPECRKCRGTGESDLQHGGRGRALLGYLRSCVGQAGADMREGAHRLRRGAKNESDRWQQRGNLKTEMERRADRETAIDTLQDTAAVAEHFRCSMGLQPASRS